MQLEVRKHLFDVLNAINEIESYAQGLDCSGFLAHGMAQAAVERKFEIIGEALNRLQRVDSSVFARITDAHRILSFRNILAHGYDVIDHAIVWDIITNHLAALKTEVEALLAQ